MIRNTNVRAGLLGEHLTHSFSPRIHAELADYTYTLKEVAPCDLEAFVKSDELDAYNVTIPYKKAIMPYLDEITPVAERIGAVNTVLRRKDGTLIGHNTDVAGFFDLVCSLGISLTGKKVLVLGSGGASRTAVTVATDAGARAVVVISRSGEDNYTNLDRHADAEILVNATPVGMYPKNGETPVSLDAFPRLEAVFDMIYNPTRTKLLQDAAARGIPYRNGLLMLVSQARRAAEFFLGESIADSEVERITAQIARETENIVLIGMPGCGKSTLGRLLAEKLGRRFVDCDTEIERVAGKPIPVIFSEDGEEAFRALETEVVAAIGRESGLVIATGGGVVTRARNLPHLAQNGRILFLDTPPESLPIAGRPLSKQKTPAVLYAERLPLYRAAADVTVTITRDVADNMKKIEEALQ